MSQVDPNKQVYVFLGPSLSLAEAKSILSEAHYLPPVKCGNIIQLLRLQPDIILIIDGYFENTASVWHKEILYALSKGVAIYGASSMGALRAAELDHFGMQGIGEIYENYCRRLIKDDDEVTVLHKSRRYDYEPISLAMIDLRITIEKARQENIVDDPHAELFINTAKALYYQERTLEKISRVSIDNGADNDITQRFLNWCQSDHYISQKAIDARAALSHIKSVLREQSVNLQRLKVSHTSYLLTLMRMMHTAPFFIYASWLPMHEKVVQFSRLLGDDYLAAKRLSRLLAIVYTIRKNEKVNNTPMQSFKMMNDELGYIQDPTFLKRMTIIFNEFDISNHKELPAQLVFIMKCFLINSGEYIKLKEQVSAEKQDDVISVLKNIDYQKYTILTYTAFLWDVIEQSAKAYQLSLGKEQLVHHLAMFCHRRKLLANDELKKWQVKNDLTEVELTKLVEMAFQFDHIVKSNNLDSINAFDHSDGIFWLLDALHLAGLYSKAKQFMHDKKACRKAILSLQKDFVNKGETYAFQLDFTHGEQGFNEFVAQIGLDEISDEEAALIEEI